MKVIVFVVSICISIICFLYLIINAIYINNTISTLDQWDEVSTGKIDCGYETDDACYGNHSTFVRSVGGTSLNNEYHLYTPRSIWYGYETTTYGGLSYHRTYTLYKHNSLIPFWTDYLVICND